MIAYISMAICNYIANSHEIIIFIRYLLQIVANYDLDEKCEKYTEDKEQSCYFVYHKSWKLGGKQVKEGKSKRLMNRKPCLSDPFWISCYISRYKAESPIMTAPVKISLEECYCSLTHTPFYNSSLHLIGNWNKADFKERNKSLLKSYKNKSTWPGISW